MTKGIHMSLNDPGRRGDNQGPPDLEEIWQDFNKRLAGMFGRKRGSGPVGPNGSNGNGPQAPNLTPRQFGGGLGALIVLALVVWLASGFYIVDTNERGVVLRLGRYVYTTEPGLHWRFPRPFESNEIVDLTGLRTVSVGSRGNARALMLTDDLNIVNVQFAVQYVLNDPRDHVFENRSPNEEFVRQIAETTMREIVGKNKMDFVLYEGREQIAESALKLIQDILNRYKAGIQVSRVTMEEVQPPEQVQAAFDDATRATQDWERQKNEGEAYANDVIPKAQGRAARLRADAEAYRARVVAAAEGESSRFRQVLTEYKRAPQVTRERMYLDAVQQVFSNTSKVMIDSKSSNNMLYLPLDKIVRQAAESHAAAPSTTQILPSPALTQSGSSTSSPRDRDLMRDRERGDR